MNRNFLAFASISALATAIACGSSTSSTNGTGGSTAGPGPTSSPASSGAGGMTSSSTSEASTGSPASSSATGPGAGGGGGMGAGGGGMGACTNAGDTTILNTKDVTGIAGTCAQNNFGQEPGTHDCIKMMTGLSDACVQCFSDDVDCTVKNCIGMCAGGMSPACQMCMDQFCTPAFQMCSGLM